MKWQPKHSSLLVIAVGFIIFYLIYDQLWLLAPVALCAAGAGYGPLGHRIHQGWMRLAKILGWINSRILLSVLFFVILTPVSLLARLFGKSSYRKTQGTGTTQFETRNHRFNREDLLHPW